MATLYTLGYQQRSIDEFIELLQESRIDVLVDVRETPWSHKPGFSKGPLVAALRNANIDYIHAKFAGNPKRLRATAPTHAKCLEWYANHIDAEVGIVDAFETLMEDLLDAGKRVCITCFERHADDCHRSILADRWRRRGRRRVEHLAVNGCERLAVPA
ncbi:MAG TPA: DUF488 domain-containing protein [Gemmatimonadaceae bacterium]|nr:DUF488 domain-containing protein [Gemmatimonadaceae bacterium]